MAVNKGPGASPGLKSRRTTSRYRLGTLEETVCMMKADMVAMELVSAGTGEEAVVEGMVTAVAVGELVSSEMSM